MPVVRLSTRTRRRSSLTPLTPAKPGIYGIAAQRPISFAPNVTPGTYAEPSTDDEMDESGTSVEDSTNMIFPPSSDPAPPPSRRRVPPHKRRSQGYIPRPPNAFMLFRADFVRQKHVPGSIETNHGTLSKIIGTCWRQLPIEQKKIWEKRAKEAKNEHKKKYPDYRFRPVHNKNKAKNKAASGAASEKEKKEPITEEDDRRCDELASLLLEGKKGNDLFVAMKEMDRMRVHSPYSHSESSPASSTQDLSSQPSWMGPNAYSLPSYYPPRRSSSVPLPSDFLSPQSTQWGGSTTTMNSMQVGGGIALPSLYLGPPGPSPVAAISRHHHSNSMGQQPTFLNNAQQQSQHQQQEQANTYMYAQHPYMHMQDPSNSYRRPSAAFLGLGLRRPSSAHAAFPSNAGQFGLSLGRQSFDAGRFSFSKWAPEPLDSDLHLGAFQYDTYGMSSSGMGMEGQLQVDTEPLPDADTSLFDPGFFLNGGNNAFPSSNANTGPQGEAGQGAVSPLDSTTGGVYATSSTVYTPSSDYGSVPPSYVPSPADSYTSSTTHSAGPSTAYSGSPEPREGILHAPAPVTATPFNVSSGWGVQMDSSEQQQQHQQLQQEYESQQGYDARPQYDAPCDAHQAFENLFNPGHGHEVYGYEESMGGMVTVV